MSGTRIAVDGLWRCLCPSFDQAALSRALRSPSPCLSPLPTRTLRKRPSNCTAPRRTRPLHTTVRRHDNSAAEAQVLPQDDVYSGAAPQESADVQVSPHNISSGVATQDGTAEYRPVTVDSLLASNPTRELLQRTRTSVIYDALRVMIKQPRRRPLIRALVKYLVNHRSQTPNAHLYEALVASNWEPSGSALEVRQILDEMKELGVGATSSLYHAALRALAVHPDYLLRNRIITEMKERWLEITLEGKCSIALGLLRDGQHELALDKLEEMQTGHLPISTWVSDIFIVVLSQHSHLDEAVALLQRRLAEKNNDPSSALSSTIWSLVLDECSRNYHYAGTRLAWDACVPSKLFIPSDGTCLHVLNTASRHSDAGLATEVVQHLSARGTKLGAVHYEALIDCYAGRDDVSSALHSLCIMAKAGIRPSHASTASVYAAFRRSPTLARVARDTLLRLGEEDGFAVPLAAFNVVLEGVCAYSSDDGADAFELYQQIRHVCGCGPDVYTFKPFMEKGWNVGVTRFLLDEMQAFGVRPTRQFYDRLVYISAVEGDLDTAFDTLGELERGGYGKQEEVEEVLGPQEWISQATALAVIRRCVAQRDERLWGLLAVVREVGLDLGPAGRALAENAMEAKVEWAKKEVDMQLLTEKEEEEREEVRGGLPPWLNGAFVSEKAASG
ncbi:hypothetical protein GE09DRAFT_646942 [Coniochaeta sp. 2T2.1]|nr:hypothetical protein GE09DRAFT_646942 [Coniochaeta sp. 2T2.1]